MLSNSSDLSGNESRSVGICGVKLIIIFVAIVVVLWQPVASASIAPSTLVDFHKHYDAFVREYLGCAPDAADIRDCHPGRGTFDVKEWLAARNAAKQLFDLRDKEAEVTAR